MTSSSKATTLFSAQWWLLLVLTLLFIAITAKLGFWQLGRAQLRERIDAEQHDSASRPPLTADELLALPPAEKPRYRRIDVEGRWLESWTVFLNRPQNGRPGFWVMTPLELSDGVVLLVQRGWITRDPVVPDKLPALKPRPARERVEGQWIEPPSHMMELAQPEPDRTAFARVRQNLELDDYQRQTGLRIAAVIREDGDRDDGLVRDWPSIASKAPMNRGYAFQWFALSAVGALYFIWFQGIRKIRNARKHRDDTIV
jgi:surfeit locus 1 family protein